MKLGRQICGVLVGGLVFLVGLEVVAGQVFVRKLFGHTMRESRVVDLRTSSPAPSASQVLDGDGPGLAADLYRPPVSAGPPSAALLLVHGNRAAGGREALYRLLARQLADRGCLVVVPSLRGFGPSEPAPADRPLTARDLLDDLERGRDLLERLAPAGVPRGLVGHSLGALLVLAAPQQPGWRTVSLEPGRDLRRRVVDPPAPDLGLFTHKLAESLRGGVVDRASVRRLYADLDPESGAPPVPAGTVLVVQGRRIGEAGRRTMRRLVASRPDASLLWLDSADHELGVAATGRFVVYPGELVGGLADTIVSFVARGETPRGRRGGSDS